MDTSTSSSRFSPTGTKHTNNNNNSNSNNTILPVHSHYHNQYHERTHSPDLEAYGNRSKRLRTPSPPLLSERNTSSYLPSLNRRWTKKQPWLIAAALAVGIILPIWIFASGIITLDKFNDYIRYLPGYSIFANNLLYLVMFLLLVSFTALSALPYFPIYMLGLPFHLLIFSIFNKLMNDWVWWCIGCYTILTLAPSLSLLLAKLRASLDITGSQQLYDIRGEAFGLRNKSSENFSSALPPSPSLSFKYSPLRNLDSDFEAESKPNNLFKSVFRAFFSRLEYCAQFMSVSNRNSIRWRMLLALGLWLSYVIPVTLGNESRDFDPARSAPSFDINHPEPLCSASVMQGIPPRYDSFEGYWQEYLQFHQQMVLPEEEGGVPEKDKRFLVFQPSDDGLGNRLQSLLSSVVMAMVTRRAIVLDWLAQPQCNANFTDLFQQPEGLQWDLNTTIPNYKEVPYYKKRPEIWYPYCRNCALRSPITPDSTWSDLLCNENLGINSTLPLVQIISTQWFLPVIQHNPYWRRELCHMFPQVNELNPEQSVGFGNAFEVLAKKLLKPSKAVQQKIDSVMDRIPEGVTLIGLQVRRTENNAVGKGIEDSFLSCAADVVAEEEEMAARESGSVWSSDLDDFSELKNDISNNNGDNNGIDDIDTDESDSAIALQGSTSFRKRYAYYLATDYRPTRAHFQRVLGDQLFVLENTFESQKDAQSLGLSASDSDRNTTENILGDESIDIDGDNEFDSDSDSDSVNIQPTTASESKQTEAVVRNSVQGVQTAVAEMFLLAQSDRIVSSPYSTFGYFAHGYANIQPNIVKRDGQCIKRKSTQPCFQYWFGFANGGAKCSIKATIDMSEDYDCWL